MPVVQGQVEEFKDEPETDRPGQKKEKFSPMPGKEGRAFASINEPVCYQDVRPPGQRKKPIPHHLYASKKKNFGNDQCTKTYPTVKGKRATTGQGFLLF